MFIANIKRNEFARNFVLIIKKMVTSWYFQKDWRLLVIGGFQLYNSGVECLRHP